MDFNMVANEQAFGANLVLCFCRNRRVFLHTCRCRYNPSVCEACLILVIRICVALACFMFSAVAPPSWGRRGWWEMSRPLNPCEQCQQTLKQQAKHPTPPPPMQHLPQIRSPFAMEVQIEVFVYEWISWNQVSFCSVLSVFNVLFVI